jgi:hypothetical protein
MDVLQSPIIIKTRARVLTRIAVSDIEFPAYVRSAAQPSKLQQFFGKRCAPVLTLNAVPDIETPGCVRSASRVKEWVADVATGIPDPRTLSGMDPCGPDPSPCNSDGRHVVIWVRTCPMVPLVGYHRAKCLYQLTTLPRLHADAFGGT